MEKDIFVENVKTICKSRKIPPTVACKESGVSTSFLSNIKQGQTPSVSKVQLLAAYLGVTTSELLGEVPLQIKKPDSGDGDGTEGRLTPDEQDLITAYRRADERARQMVDLALEPYIPPMQSREAM